MEDKGFRFRSFPNTSIGEIADYYFRILFNTGLANCTLLTHDPIMNTADLLPGNLLPNRVICELISITTRVDQEHFKKERNALALFNNWKEQDRQVVVQWNYFR